MPPYKCGTERQHCDRVISTGKCRVCELMEPVAADPVNVRLARDIAHLEGTARIADARGRRAQGRAIRDGVCRLREALGVRE